MTEQEKLTDLKLRILPDVVDDALLRSFLRNAERIVLNRRYPFGYKDGTTVPTRYEDVQMDIAVELYSKIGVEGQIGHSESGTNRTWESAHVSKSLLNKITPVVGCITKE